MEKMLARKAEQETYQWSCSVTNPAPGKNAPRKSILCGYHAAEIFITAVGMW
jgi:hypothetical protein